MTAATEPVAPAPVAAPTPASPAPAAPAPQGGLLDRRSARQAMHESQKAKTPEPAAPAAPPTPAEPAAAAPVAPVAEVPKPGETTPPETKAPDAPAPTTFSFTIPADHPAARGQERKYTFATQGEADAMAALVKGTYVRPRELTEAQQRAETAELELARIKANQDAVQEWQKTPDFKAAQDRNRALQQLEASGEVPAGTADRDWKQTLADFHLVAETKFEEIKATRSAEQNQQAAKAWANEAWVRSAARLPDAVRALPEYPTLWQQAYDSFESEMELGHFPQVTDREVMHEEFRKFLSIRLGGSVAVQAVLNANQTAKKQAEIAAAARAAEVEAERKRIAEAAVEEFKRSSAAAHRGAPPHPLGNLQRPAGDRATPQTPATDVRPAPDNRTGNEVRREQRQLARERGRQITGG